MIMSKTNEETTRKKFSQLSLPIQTTIQNTSVKLAGTTQKGSIFLGSGVILYSYDSETYVITAKHNLYIFAEEQERPAWNDDLVTSFQHGVTVCYAEPMEFGKEPVCTAPISTIEPVKISDEPPWDYDVMILKSTDTNLNNFAVLNRVYDYPIPEPDRNALSAENRYLSKAGQASFVQTGYGKVRDTAEGAKETTLPKEKAGDNKEGGLQYRFTKPLATATVAVYSQREGDKAKYDRFFQAIQLTADANSSTAPGDSGGPLFVVRYDKEKQCKLFLIGITTGADMAAAQETCPPPGALRVNTIATSLELCYKNGQI